MTTLPPPDDMAERPKRWPRWRPPHLLQVTQTDAERERERFDAENVPERWEGD